MKDSNYQLVLSASGSTEYGSASCSDGRLEGKTLNYTCRGQLTEADKLIRGKINVKLRDQRRPALGMFKELNLPVLGVHQTGVDSVVNLQGSLNGHHVIKIDIRLTVL